MEYKKINEEKIKSIPGVENDPLNIKGKELFQRPYPNVMLWARKNSGKTTVIFHILKKRADKDTVIVLMVPTVFNDKNWIAIAKYFKKKGNQVIVHTSMVEDGVDRLAAMIKALQDEAEEKARKENERETKEDKPKKLIKFDDSSDEDEEPKQRKKKFLAPRFIFVFDDISDELRRPSLISLLKKNRHFQCMTILSSQDIKDATPASIKNVEYWMIWGGADEKRLLHIYNLCCIWIPFHEFLTVYQKATEEKYSFLYIDTVQNEFRRNFSDKIII
jgi:hypothetical protein